MERAESDGMALLVAAWACRISLYPGTRPCLTFEATVLARGGEAACDANLRRAFGRSLVAFVFYLILIVRES